ncbi:MAG: DAK2 domain-containing protein [Ruminococcus sp.]|nr:DAK2 domain-containing protein [Ruminococcus sp.]
MTKTINGLMYLNMLRGGARNLGANRAAVNDLNVFPIPDGDTGDNMFMTIDAGASKTAESALLGEVANHAAHEMLLGARGNSGVILSRIFAGIGKGLESEKEADIARFIFALQQGVSEAYRAVSNPVEGTILTVYREAVETVTKEDPDSFEALFDVMLRELAASLERTPDLLDVLKEAGVVDSGGAGFVYIAEGMKAALSGLEFGAEMSAAASKSVDLDAFTEDSVLDFGYCTEFLLRLQKSKIDIDSFDLDAFIGWLNSVGDSVVAFREGTIVKVHVHTKRPGDILNRCQEYGEFLTTKIENMTLQHNEAHGKGGYQPKNTKPKKPYGIVTVAAGEGLKEIFTSLGVDAVVDGGQSMNPSAQDMLDAYEAIGAQTVYVFPNNSNIVLTAEQAAAMAQGIDVRIIKTKTIGEGYAAISMFDITVGDTDAVVAYLDEIIEGVVTGIVSVASRDVAGEVEVVKGDYIGFVGDDIYVDEKTPEQAMIGLCEKLGAKNYDVMLILAGADADTEKAAEMYDTLKRQYRRTEVIMLQGDQPIYDYIMILE